jgi:hypothetical protein
MRRGLVLAALAGAVMAVFTGCGGGETTTVVEEPAGQEAPAKAESATERRIEKIERETQEAELEAAQAKKAAAQQAARAKRAAATQARQAAVAEVRSEEESSSEPPDVVGLRLPQAKAELAAAGFTTKAENTDTVFGIVVPSHYTVCEESLISGNAVRVLAQKYGC